MFPQKNLARKGLIITDSRNGLVLNQDQTIVWTNEDLLARRH